MFHSQQDSSKRQAATACAVSKLVTGVMLCAAIVTAVPAAEGQVVAAYTELPLGTGIDLTAEGTLDWVKWGVNGGGPAWTAVSKAGVVPLISRTIAPLGTPPPGTSVVMIGIASIPPRNVLNFTWSDGTGPVAGVPTRLSLRRSCPPSSTIPWGLERRSRCRPPPTPACSTSTFKASMPTW